MGLLAYNLLVREKSMWILLFFNLILAMTMSYMLMSFLVHFEQILGSYDFFKWNETIFCTSTETFCIGRLPLRTLLVTPLI